MRAEALAAYARFCDESFLLLPAGDRHLRAAARIVDQYALGLRGGDALHLAICADYGATLCTLDERLLQAAPALGVPAQAP